MDHENVTDSSTSWVDLLNFSARRRVSVVLQTEAAECGLACIAMLADYHGIKTDLLSLRSSFPTSLRGSRLSDMTEIAGTLGLNSRAIQVDIENLNQLFLPCVLHWNMNHFVVLTSVKRGYIEIVDPSIGRRRIKTGEASNHFTGVALEVDAGPKVQRGERPAAVSLRTLTGSINGIGRSLTQLFALALFIELTMLLAPQFMQFIVDQVLASADDKLLTFLGLSFSFLLVMRLLVEGLRTWTVMWLSANINISWTANVFTHLLKLPLDYFSNRYLGDVISRFNAITVIQQTITTQFVMVLIDGIMAIATAGMLLVYNVKLAALTIAFAAIYALLRALYFRVYQETNLTQINVSAIQQSTLIESIRAIQTIRLNNKGSERGARYINATADSLNVGVKIQKLNLLFDAMNGATTGAQRIAVLWVGAWFALRGHMTAGMLMAFLAYADQFTNRFVALTDFAVQFKLLRLHGERLADIVLTPPEMHSEGAYLGPIKSKSVAFDEVCFRYTKNSPLVLNCSTFRIEEGEIVAITGVSGCGKSTIAKMLLGINDYDSGSVTIGGVDMRALGKRRVRSLVSCVMQNDELLSGSILENITLFDQAASLERAQLAARQSYIAEEIESMPMGYLTTIGDMGSSLSGGQQQRLLLARAFYREPAVLVLDEATSQLDIECEKSICQSVRESGVTALVVAHRPQTILAADRIFIMHAGQLIEVSKDEMRVRFYGNSGAGNCGYDFPGSLAL